jgi:glycolate oxidase
MAILPLKEIARIVGRDQLLTSAQDRHCYGYDASRLHGLPDAVAFPGNADEVAALLKLANRDGFPIFPRGAGSGMVGAAVPWSGGLVLAMNRFNRILEIDEEDMIAVAEPGVVTGALQQAVEAIGLFYPPDPASLHFSTLGGNVAMGAGGPRGLKYGVTRDYVLGLEVVLPHGAVLKTGTRTTKGVVGYDLTRLMVGSEGTLGIFTRITVRLIPRPPAVRTLCAVFPRLEAAGEAVCALVRARILPATVEILDQTTLKAVENHLHLGLPTAAEAVLLIEIDGEEWVLERQLIDVENLCRRLGASPVQTARSHDERERLWRARRAVSPALGRIRPGKINEDITVPRSRIPELLRFISGLAQRHRLVIASFGHAGDGNLHTNILLDRSDAEERARAERAVGDLCRHVLELGGTISGEHGVGIAKSPFFHQEVGREGWEAMWAIKRALDPLNILNPGKMFVPNRVFFGAL